MTHEIQLRTHAGAVSDEDITLTAQTKTFEYLKTSNVEQINVSAYLDRDWPHVAATFAEVYLEQGCVFRVTQITPGSRTRKVSLPGAMKSGEQLVIRVTR